MRGLPHSFEAPAEGRSRLVPILKRVIELDRGPGALVGWVRGQLAQAGSPAIESGPTNRDPVVGQLAAELARRLQGNGVEDTMSDRVRRTLRSPPAAAPLEDPPVLGGFRGGFVQPPQD